MNHWRSLSTKEIAEIGRRIIALAKRVIRSNASSEAPPSGWEIAGGTAEAGIRLIHAPLLSQMLVARLAVLEHLHEGLLVLPGGGQEHSFADSLAAERRVPVLIVQGTGAAE